jgi:hypothetical protein
MEDAESVHQAPLCPSAQPEMEGSVVFGVVGGMVTEPWIAYLDQILPVNDEILALTQLVKSTEVLRFAAPCAGRGCQHFDGTDCRLAKRTVRMLPIVTDRLPACRIRPNCRWFQQEGKAACLHCPPGDHGGVHPTRTHPSCRRPDYAHRGSRLTAVYTAHLLAAGTLVGWPRPSR